MNAASLLEMLNVPVAVANQTLQVSAQTSLAAAVQPFKESLLVASQTIPVLTVGIKPPANLVASQQPVSVELPQPPQVTQTANGLVPAILKAPPNYPQKAPVARRLHSDESSVAVAASSAPVPVEDLQSICQPSLPVSGVQQSVIPAPASSVAAPASLPSVNHAERAPAIAAPIQSSDAPPIPAANQENGPILQPIAPAEIQPTVTNAIPTQSQGRVVALPPVTTHAVPLGATVTVTKAAPVTAPTPAPEMSSRSVLETTPEHAAASNPPVIAAHAPPATQSPAPATHRPAGPPAMQEAAQKATPVSAQQADPPAPSTVSSTRVLPAEQASVVYPTTPTVQMPPAPVSSSVTQTSTVAGSKDAGSKLESDATGSKQHQPAASDQTGSASAQTGTNTGNPSQGSPQQVQPAAITPGNGVSHAVAGGFDHAQAAASSVPPQNVAPLAAAATHAAKVAQASAPGQEALPEPTPTVNTARLIQNATQSELRVGMRSTDFGNISISTSATRDVISAQISLDHGELAKALTTHIPEMQSSLGGNQRMEIRIDTNGQPAGQGSTGGMSAAPGDDSRGGQQSRGNSASSHIATGVTETINVTAAVPAPPAEAAHTRLDVRV